jgi:preprotein translocase subunit SecE
MAKVSPATYLRQVRQEVEKITWPSRKETALSTVMVIAMVIVMALFFFVVDQLVGLAVRGILGIGG